ncbi:AAA family ATPase [Actinoplanes sp. CA-015351]|uniref:AAA family ATPase n=1 Tax=Actinoplanes sp. CA-015351 TaxID=3239897 RepID=UPI003D9934EE
MLDSRVISSVDRFNTIRQTLKAAYVARDQAIDLLVLGTICGEHVLLLGPSGTAKTDLVTRYAQLITARKFSYLLTRFTEPTELFGPVDISELGKGRYRVRTDNMLPEAEIAFLDEIFHAGSAVLNTLLSLLNERKFHNGPDYQPVPLVTMVGAANELPDDPALTPIADRFLLRHLVEPVADADIPRLIELGWDHRWRREPGTAAEALATIDDLAALNAALYQVRLKPVLEAYTMILTDLRRSGLRISDRRAVRCLKLVAGAALLRCSDEARTRDLWPLGHVWSAPADRALVQDAVQQIVQDDGGMVVTGFRSPHEVLTEARSLAARSGLDDLSRLQQLGRLRHELRRHGDDAAVAAIDEIIRPFLEDPTRQPDPPGGPSQEGSADV